MNRLSLKLNPLSRSQSKPSLIGKSAGGMFDVTAVLVIVAATLLLVLPRTRAQSTAQASPEPPAAQQQPAAKPVAPAKAPVDLTKQPTLFVVGYAHLDTEWRWEYPQVIDEYLSKTLRTNFYLFEKYPHYIFNFTGANRFMMMKEYFPADFAKLKHYVQTGRWFPAGSSMEENDVNSPSAESIIRQVLYGNEFFRHEFGKASEEYMLPDCFGFPASLPSILAHAGVKGFSTQKLNAAWQPAPHVGGPDSPEKTPEGIPFDVGIWEGPDGKTIIAALNPGSYGDGVYTDLTKNNTPPAGVRAEGYVWDWPDRVNLDGKVTGVYADYHYVGTGDIGGAPPEDSVKLMEAIETKGIAVLPSPQSIFSEEEQPTAATGPRVKVGDGPLHVVWSDADQMFRDIKPSETGRMPRYKGDLELINHSAGSITSQTYHKRWNRENEVLGASAEEASVAAAWLGGRPYPLERLNHAWRLVMGGQFHDIMAGTATPKSYEYSWNDDVIALNQFASVLTTATEAVGSAMNTEGQGTPIIVFNPLNIARQDVAEADISFPNGVPQGVRVVGPDGKEVPAQLAGQTNNGDSKVLFLADVPSVGYAVYDVQPADSATAASSALQASESGLENERYRIKIDENGDVSSIFDKRLNRELLSAPIRLAILTDNPQHWPAWNMDFEDEQRPPRTYIGGPAQIRVVENGPVRVAVEVSREGEDSKFVQTVRLSAGDAGNRVEFSNAIDWKAKQANLKSVFPLTASNPNATYNWDIGTIQRPNEFDRQFEVASHRWVDLTDKSGTFGVTILTDDKNASDKPNDNTLRLTLMRTPGTRGGYEDQGTQDWGHHEFVFGLAAHEGDWCQGQTDWQAYRLNEPLKTFETSSHPGFLGKTFSLLKTSNSRVNLMALKKAEDTDEVVVRLVEMSGKSEPDVRISFPAAVTAARELNGQEQPIGTATVKGGELVASFSAYQPRTLAVKLAKPHSEVAEPAWKPVALTYDASVATRDGKPAEGCFDCDYDQPDSQQGRALPAEMLPTDVAYAGIHFHLGPAGGGNPDAMTARGQTIHFPAGKFNQLYLLAASYDGDQTVAVRVGSKSVDLKIEDWGGFIGQWDTRTWNEKTYEVPTPPEPAADDHSPRAERARRFRAYVKEHGPIIRTIDEYTGLEPAYIKRAPVAWFASHNHTDDGSNEAYSYSYLFAYEIDLPPGVTEVTLPNNPRIRILAATVADKHAALRAAEPLYDMLDRANVDMKRWNTGIASNTPPTQDENE
jgi:alpha-mannosidase